MTPHDDSSWADLGNGAVTRRRLLQVGGAGALTLGMGSLISACGAAGGQPAATADAVSGAPQRGGTLRIGATGGGTSDTLDAQNSLTTIDFLRAGALYEQLMIMNPLTGRPDYALAELVESNKSGTEWTIRVRPDVTFHNGAPLSSKDVLYSLQRIATKKLPGLINLGPINLDGAKVLDARTLRIPFHQPYAVLAQGLADIFTIRMVPRGYNPKQPIGTGPFKYQSFTPGTRSEFVRYDGYWQHGKPYLDTLIVIDFADETAQVNALQSGQVDLIDQLSYTSVASVKGSGGKVTASKTRAFVPLTMRVDTAPFSDVRVRQALRLVVDRPQFNEQIFGGLGAIGNDVFGAIDPAYQGLLPQREQDLEQAKSLLKSAGQSDLRVSLYSAATGPGAESGAAVFATQAKQAGVSVNLITQQATQFWSQSYSKVPFALSIWNPASYLIMAGQGLAKGAPFDETHQSSPGWQRLYNEAIKTVRDSTRDHLVQQMIKFDYDHGGYIIPVYYPTVEGMLTKVNGDTENISGNPVNGSNGLQNVWIQS